MDIILLFSLVVICECIALYYIKYCSSVKDTYYLPISVLCYSLIPIFLYLIVKNGNDISTVNITWNIMSTLYGIAIGMILFKEDISTLQWYGIIMGTLSLVLLFYQDKN